MQIPPLPIPTPHWNCLKIGEGVKKREWGTATEMEKQLQTQESAPSSVPISSAIQAIKNAASAFSDCVQPLAKAAAEHRSYEVFDNNENNNLIIRSI